VGIVSFSRVIDGTRGGVATTVLVPEEDFDDEGATKIESHGRMTGEDCRVGRACGT
jgi:hypothetical protein